MSQLVAYSGTTKQYVRRILRLAALSLLNTDAILSGRHPSISPMAYRRIGKSRPCTDQFLNFIPQRLAAQVLLHEVAPVTFSAVHGYHVDAAANVYIEDWNQTGRVTTLERVTI